jgi:hypothetical protein
MTLEPRAVGIACALERRSLEQTGKSAHERRRPARIGHEQTDQCQADKRQSDFGDVAQVNLL